MGVEGLSGGRWTAKSIRSAPQPKPQAGRRCWCVRPNRYGDPCQRSIPATHKSRPWRPGYAARSIPLVFSRPAVSWGRRMQTNFAPEQLADPAMRTSEAVIRKRSEEHTSELQSLMRSSYAVFCLKIKSNTIEQQQNQIYTQVTRI